MEFYTITDKGKVRTNNEDFYTNLSSDKFHLFIVCDGMGGHNSGEVASRIACETISKHVKENYDKMESFDLIAESVKLAHDNISEISEANESHRGMGTTMVLCLIIGSKLYYANVGDSRIYIYRDGLLNQITKDHSYVQELIDSGAIDEEEAKFYPRNQITSALGTSIKYKMDLKVMDLVENDYILLTTDGLTDLIDDDDIHDVIENEYNVRETCEILQYMANSTGGKDNITITVARFK